MIKRITGVFLAALTALFCFASCGKDTGEGKSIIFPIDNDPVYLDPQIAQDKGAKDIIGGCYEGLVRLNENGEIVPGAAKSWMVSKDKKTYTFTIREDASWYFPKSAAQLVDEEAKEGYEEKLTADDFVFAFRRALRKSTNAKDADCLMAIKNAAEVHSGKLSEKQLGVKKTESGKLRITLEYQDSDFLRTLTRAICMPCNEKFFELTKGRYGLSLQYIIGNGPFYMGSWVTDKSVTIKKNPYYHGENEALPQSVFFSVNNEFSLRAKKLSSGTYDVTPLDFGGYTQLKDEKGISFIESENIVWSLVFNCEDEFIKNLSTRLAVLYGFDTSLMTQSENMSEKAQHLVAKSVLSQNQLKKNKISIPKYNISKATGYWEKALEELSVSAMSITIKCTQTNEKDVRAVLQNLQKAFGISCDVRVNALEEGELKYALEKGDYQIAYAPVSAPSDSALDYLRYAAEIASYESGEFKSALSCIRKADIADKDILIKNAEEHLINNGVIVPLFSAKSYLAMGEGVSGVFTDYSRNVTSFNKTLKID